MISLNWQTKERSRLLACEDERVKSIKNSDGNILINGDNLNVLKSLTHNYTAQIDIIYIDPPYNTKNHKFLYDDKFSDSQWLDFIYPRLILASTLLSEDGVIFISIDDNEVSELRILLNEIFGKQNFISQFVWQKKNKPSFLHQKTARINEYILAYAKDINKIPMLSVEYCDGAKKYPLNFKNNPKKELLFRADEVRFKLKDGVVKAQDMSSKTIKCSLLNDVEIKDFKNKNDFKMLGEWRYTQKYLDELIKLGATLSVGKIPFRINLTKHTKKPKMISNFLTKSSLNIPTYEDANAEILELFGFEAFSKAKPVGLIKTLIKSTTYLKKDAVILDFFGGSGTTAHAVMELNYEDDGDRKFILVQNSQKIDKKYEAYQKGYKTIYELMKKRVELVCQKYKNKFVEYNF
jgi:adenine-specific DNA-methyltransferase